MAHFIPFTFYHRPIVTGVRRGGTIEPAHLEIPVSLAERIMGTSSEMRRNPRRLQSTAGEIKRSEELASHAGRKTVRVGGGRCAPGSAPTNTDRHEVEHSGLWLDLCSRVSRSQAGGTAGEQVAVGVRHLLGHTP